MRKSFEHKVDVLLKKNISYSIDKSDFELLGPQLPLVHESLHHENLKTLQQNLKLMETSLQTIKNRRRTKTWLEKGSDALTYLGYISIGIITTYIMYKIGLFSLISKCIRKTLCIKLFCVNTNINATSVVHYAAVATAPTLEDGNVTIIPKTIRLRTSRLTRGVRLVSDAEFFVTLQVKRGFQTMKKKIVFWAIVNI